MKQQGITQKELAERLGVSEPALSMQLKSDGMSLQRLNVIAKVMGVEMVELIARNENSASSNMYCPHCGKPIKVTLG